MARKLERCNSDRLRLVCKKNKSQLHTQHKSFDYNSKGMWKSTSFHSPTSGKHDKWRRKTIKHLNQPTSAINWLASANTILRQHRNALQNFKKYQRNWSYGQSKISGFAPGIIHRYQRFIKWIPGAIIHSNQFRTTFRSFAIFGVFLYCLRFFLTQISNSVERTFSKNRQTNEKLFFFCSPI